ncbi:hypothetical protein [Agrobacterium tumefaciens]|uniref:hypothetical protein n=1 Tax=Agrobacterium tumefaciens TaxID=358 RepID=UPI001571C905|nr:hypothetical protein [Agrobacterium tumefaciens]
MPSLEAGFKPPSPFEDDGGAHILRICQKRKKHTEEKNSQSHFATSCEDAQILARSFTSLPAAAFAAASSHAGVLLRIPMETLLKPMTSGLANWLSEKRPELFVLRMVLSLPAMFSAAGCWPCGPVVAATSAPSTVFWTSPLFPPGRLIRHNADRARG